MIAGLYADKFDQMATVTNFVIVPLSFLSGTFYSIDKLPEILKTLSYYNPFFHMIDGFRYSFIGQSDGSIKFGIIFLLIISFITFIFLIYCIKEVIKLKHNNECFSKKIIIEEKFLLKKEKEVIYILQMVKNI